MLKWFESSCRDVGPDESNFRFRYFNNNVVFGIVNRATPGSLRASAANSELRPMTAQRTHPHGLAQVDNSVTEFVAAFLPALFIYTYQIARQNMNLVGYSDSESDGEVSRTAPKPSAATKPKPTFQTTWARKIRVDLPSLSTAQESLDNEAPPTKRVRTTGTFGGFNSLLPPPKKPAQQPPTLRKGISLKTSAEAAFSRRPAPQLSETHEAQSNDATNESENFGENANGSTTRITAPEDIQLIGNATRFKPLSVANKKKGPPKKPKVIPNEQTQPPNTSSVTQQPTIKEPADTSTVAKPTRKSLFSIDTDSTTLPEPSTTTAQSYESFLNPQFEPDEMVLDGPAPRQNDTAPAVMDNSLEAVAADLNLTTAQRRQLFGRNANNIPSNISVANFNINSEYASNEQLRLSGQAVEHRAVKTIAAGKHSLQQLVNNARSNQESMEDKWAEGRRNRGEGGSKYGWGQS